jgi:hypothetical protein
VFDPSLDGFGIIFTMQTHSRLRVIEASKAFSQIEFLKELPICSTIRGKNLAEFAFSFQSKILSSIPCLMEPAEQANKFLYAPDIALELYKTLKGETAEIYFEALSVHLFRFSLGLGASLTG